VALRPVGEGLNGLKTRGLNIRQNTAAFVHEILPGDMSDVDGASTERGFS
jgi:hypothetical protein